MNVETATEAQYERFFNFSPDMLCIAGFDGYFKDLNPAWARTLGFTNSELKAKPLLDFVHPEDGEKTAAAERELKLGNEVISLENRFRHKDSSYRWILWTLTPIPDRQLIYAIAHDITERKRAEESLRKTEELLRYSQRLEATGRLAGGVAHDFNNLLTVIASYSEFLIQSLSPDDPRRSDVEEIKKAAARAAALTHQLLAFSRKQVIQPRVLDLNSVVSDMEMMLRRLIGEDMELSIVLGAEPASVRADSGHLEQVVLNLVVNARDAMPRGGKMTIETSLVRMDEAFIHRHGIVEPGSYVMLAVSDTGCGIGEENKAHLFEPYFTTKERGKGTGLGLSMVYGIVTQSGGHITVYSEEGRGTVFKVYLPRVLEALEEEEPRPAPESVFQGTGTILLVEDDGPVRHLIGRTLSGSGFAVLEAGSAEEALAVCGRCEGPILLMVTDMVLPGLSGPELAARLKSSRPETKVIYMSGYTDHAVLKHGMLGLDKIFLQKPFTPSALLRKVRDTLAPPPP